MDEPAMSAATLDDDEIAGLEIADPGGIERNHDRTHARLSGKLVHADPSCRGRPLALAQIAPGDLDITIVG